MCSQEDGTRGAEGKDRRLAQGVPVDDLRERRQGEDPKDNCANDQTAGAGLPAAPLGVVRVLRAPHAGHDS